MMHRPAVEPFRFRQAPVLFAALCFAAGELLAHHLWLPPARLYTALLLLFLLCVVALWRAQRVLLCAIAGIWFAVGAFALQGLPQPFRPLQAESFADGLSRRMEGVVVDLRKVEPPQHLANDGVTLQPWEIEPGGWEQSSQPARLLVDVKLRALEEVSAEEAHMVPVEGVVRLSLTGVTASLRCGDILQIPVRLQIPEEYRDDGAWSRRQYLLDQGIGLEAKAPGAKLVLSRHGKATLSCRLHALQQRATEALQDYARWQKHLHWPAWMLLNENDIDSLQAMLFGERHGLESEWREDLERTGTFHLVVVSGLHVTVLAGLLLWLLRKLPLPEIVRVLLTLSIVTGFALLTGFGLPVQRALLMCAVYLMAHTLDRDRSGMNALGIAALCVLLLDPRALFTASFQMTFCVVVAVAGIAAPLNRRSYGRYHHTLDTLNKLEADAWLPPPVAAFRVRIRLWREVISGATARWIGQSIVPLLRLFFTLCDSLLFCAVVELCMTLPLIVHFHRVALLALPVNLLVAPMIFLLLALALLMFLLSLAANWLAAPVAVAVAVGMHLLRWIIVHAGNLRFAEWRAPQPGTLRIAAVCLVLAFVCWAVRFRRPWPWIGIATLTAAITLLACFPAPPRLQAGQLEITAIDVGQGDSIFIATPEGRTMLIDGGGPTGGFSPKTSWDVGENVVSPYLWSRGLSRLDVVALSHAHSDHMGGLPAVLKNFRPRELWLSVMPTDAPELQQLLQIAQQTQTRLRWLHEGQSLPFGSVHIDVLSPSASYTPADQPSNDDSLVLDLQCGHAEALLEGDAEKSSEANMLASGKLHAVTLLKVAHHGSRTSTTEAFATSLHPRIALISVGKRNTFGHPREEVLATLEQQGTRTFRTDRAGAVTVLLDPAEGSYKESDLVTRR